VAAQPQLRGTQQARKVNGVAREAAKARALAGDLAGDEAAIAVAVMPWRKS